MLCFEFTEEQKLMVRNLRNYAREELLPNYACWDRSEQFPAGPWRRMAELGLTGLRVPKECGGLEADSVTTGLAAEEIARGDVNCAYAVLVPCIMGELLGSFSNPPVFKNWLVEMVKGEKIIALALTEPHCGSDASAIRARAVRDDDFYILQGEKSAISVGMAADAMIVFAKTDPHLGARGVSVFLVPMDLEGITRQSYQDLGSKAIKRCSVFLDEVRVPAENLIGSEGKGFYQAMRSFDLTRVIIALMAIGAAEQTLEETVEYIKNRVAFGKPIARFEGVSFPVVEQATMLEAARLLCYKALWLRDKGLPHTKEAAMAKWLGPKLAVDAIRTCLLLHGHYGYTQEFPVEQRLRDVMGLQIADGTAQIQKIVISREIIGRDYMPY